MLVALALLGDPRVKPLRRFLLTNTVVYVGLNLAVGAAAPGIDNAAHVGGLASGLAAGIALHLQRAKREAEVEREEGILRLPRAGAQASPSPDGRPGDPMNPR